MKLSIRWKLMLFIAGLSLAVLVNLAYSIYKVSYKKVYDSFINNKFTLVKAIAGSIDGDIHFSFTTPEATQHLEYKRYQKYLNNLKTYYDPITYLYTINYDSTEGKFVYCLDGDISENNKFWIESEKFAVEINIDSLNHAFFKYKQKKYPNKLNFRLDNQSLTFLLSNTDSSIIVTVNEKFLAEIFSNGLFYVKIGSSILNEENRGINRIVEVNDLKIDAYLSLSLQGEALTIPGDYFEETPENIQLYKQILGEGKDYVSFNLTESIYGRFVTAIAVIRNSNEKPVGLACLEVYENELLEFKKSFTRITIIISIVSILLILITIPFLLELFVVNKIKRIDYGIHRIAEKDLDVRINIKSRDEFESVANGFNLMGEKLKDFYENLEEMVNQRTATIMEQKEELANLTDCIKEANTLLIEKNSEIEDQKSRIETQNSYLKQINEKLMASEENLRLLVQTKDKLFSIIAHDLRSPFTALVGLTEVLTRQADELNPTEVAEYSKMVHISSHKLLALIENLLKWSRCQTGRLKLEPTTLNLANLATEAVDLLSVQANAKGISLLNQIQNEIKVFADSETISTVLRNLLSNAIKFTQSGGQVIISARQSNSHVTVSILDNGIGMSPETVGKLFKIEESFSTVGTNDEKGTGLGLIVCKEFIEKNGGQISVMSKLGKGTVFNFTLPITQ